MRIRVNYLLDTADMLGISSVDIKRVEQVVNMDMYKITTWNRRTLYLSGIDVVLYYRNKYAPVA